MQFFCLWTIQTHITPSRMTTIPRWGLRRRRWDPRLGSRVPRNRRFLCKIAVFLRVSPRAARFRGILSNRPLGTRLSHCLQLWVFRRIWRTKSVVNESESLVHLTLYNTLDTFIGGNKIISLGNDKHCLLDNE